MVLSGGGGGLHAHEHTTATRTTKPASSRLEGGGGHQGHYNYLQNQLWSPVRVVMMKMNGGSEFMSGIDETKCAHKNLHLLGQCHITIDW